jgi:glycosyltransferase involved in cell wall biosynthesis
VGSPEAVFVSYRLGGDDGVAVEAAKWEWALHELGFTVRRVAGEFGTLRPDDTWLPFLAIDPVPGAELEPGALAAAIAGADLVVVENICSLPLNESAATFARDVVMQHEGRVCFHHHDFAWERPRLAHLTGFPPERTNSLHVTISEHARRGLRARGIDSTCIPNSFDFDVRPGDRDGTRSGLEWLSDDVVLLQPTRAILRKNFSGGVQFAERVADRIPEARVQYWITGPPEDGFDEEFATQLRDAGVPVHVGRAPNAVDAYAASDLVVFPSTWEGFGNPVIEAVAARRMVAVGAYPVLAELSSGMTLLSVDDPDSAAEWLRAPNAVVIEENYERARARFSIEHLPERLAAALAEVGWESW